MRSVTLGDVSVRIGPWARGPGLRLVFTFPDELAPVVAYLGVDDLRGLARALTQRIPWWEVRTHGPYHRRVRLIFVWEVSHGFLDVYWNWGHGRRVPLGYAEVEALAFAIQRAMGNGFQTIPLERTVT